MNRTIIDNRKLIKEHIEEVERSSSKDNNLFLIQEAIKKFGGRLCKFPGDQYGYVIGATSDVWDYYWCYLDENGKIGFSTCCSNPTLEDGGDKHEFTQLLHAVRMCPDLMFSIIKEQTKEIEDVFFTDVYIGDKIFSRHAMNH